MSADEPARVVIRSRFWPLFLRWVVALQLLFALVVVVTAGSRGACGLPLVGQNDPVNWGGTFALLGLSGFAMTAAQRNLDRAHLTLVGIRPARGLWMRGELYPWSQIESVRVKTGRFGIRWLEVWPLTGELFLLTAHLTDPAGVLDALERFAGPNHPLTQAYATLLGDP